MIKMCPPFGPQMELVFKDTELRCEQDGHQKPQPFLFLLAFSIGKSSLETLFEGLFAQIHIDLSWFLAGIEPGTCG